MSPISEHQSLYGRQSLKQYSTHFPSPGLHTTDGFRGFGDVVGAGDAAGHTSQSRRRYESDRVCQRLQTSAAAAPAGGVCAVRTRSRRTRCDRIAHSLSGAGAAGAKGVPAPVPHGSTSHRGAGKRARLPPSFSPLYPTIPTASLAIPLRAPFTFPPCVTRNTAPIPIGAVSHPDTRCIQSR